MKINPSLNPLRTIQKLQTTQQRKIDLPEHISTSQSNTPYVQNTESSKQVVSPLLDALTQKMNELHGKSVTDIRSEMEKCAVETVVNDLLQPGTLSSAELAEMKTQIAEFIHRDPLISKKIDSIVNRLASVKN